MLNGEFLESAVGGSFTETHGVLPDGIPVILRTRREATRASRSWRTQVTSAVCRMAPVDPSSIERGAVKIDLADSIQQSGTAERLAKAVLSSVWNIQMPAVERVDADLRTAQIAEDLISAWLTRRVRNVDGTTSFEPEVPLLSGRRGNVLVRISDLRSRSVGYWGWFISGSLVSPTSGDQQARILIQLDGRDDLNSIIGVCLAAMQRIWRTDPLTR